MHYKILRSVFRLPILLIGSAVIVVVVMAAAASLSGASDDPVEVIVRCEALKGRTGVRLGVLHSTPLGVALLKRDSPSTFDGAGECRVNLRPDEYLFEVGFVDGNKVFVLRSPARRIARGAVVELRAEEPNPLSLKLSDDRAVQIEELAVRSAAATGEITWSGNSNGQPLLILSPGQEYRVRVLGGGDNLRFAAWRSISTTRSVVRLDGDQVCRCKFKIRTDGAVLQNARVRLQFPDAEMRFPVTDKTIFLTNRRFVSFGYGADLANGRRIVVRPWLGIVSEEQELLLGGPFTAEAWAKIMVRKPVGGPETKHLIWDANLYDGRGHMVLEDKSQIDFHQSIRSVSGAEVPRGHPLSKEEIASFFDREDAVLVDVSYHLDSPVSLTLRPKRFQNYGNRRFYTHAPPHWELQALNYLSRAERVFHMIEDLENKRSKHRVEVRWHAMNGTAWGCGPSGNNAYIMMPFSGLKDSFNFYDSPWALAHEMLHTFGYGHGTEMNRMSSLVEKRFDQYRWYMADHPELDPETAFDGFRIATHVDRVTNPPQPQKGGMKNGKNAKKKKK
jgi:hypothetical protein